MEGQLDPAARQREEELESLGLLLRDGRRDYALRSLDERGGAQELVRQQYTGRYPFELLQNANDAARETGRRGRARFVLTEAALLVADNGTGFGVDQVRAICSLGRSSKGPGTSIGHKGLGFKSVGEITDQPQILSSGLSFQFDQERLHDELTNLCGSLPDRQRLPVYAFPFPVAESDLSGDAATVRELLADGFNTVIRLPFRSGVDRSEVALHLTSNLTERLLLFLPNVDHLELRGTAGDFSAEVARDDDGTVEHAILETDGKTAEWLIYRGEAAPSADLLRPMGEAWEGVETLRFAIAVPLNADSQPVADEVFPLHVYFPTEERPELQVAVHAEWALTMDRRRIATTPEATDLNDYLIGQVAAFAASTVAGDLVSRCDAASSAVEVLIPRETFGADGATERIVAEWRRALADSNFLPFVDGTYRSARSAQLLPYGITDLARAHQLADLAPNAALRPEVEGSSTVREFVEEFSEIGVLADGDYLALMAAPNSETVEHFYRFLVAWRDSRGHGLIDALRLTPCVLTTNGSFLAPGDKTIFFPRKDASVPDDIPVPIAALPAVDGLLGLLVDLGVKEFEWRDLIREYLAKILEDPGADPIERQRAFTGLRSYQAVRRSGGEDVGLLLRRVLLPARDASGSNVGLFPAGQIYFGQDWTGSDALERIYGAFSETEFLGIEVPDDADQRRNDVEFYRMLGVADCPRLDAVTTKYALDGGRHPHNDATFKEWLSALGTDAACQQGHKSYQELITSYKLDRFGELASSGDPARLLALWGLLALHWGKIYEDGLSSTIRCNHGWHTGDKVRRVESLFSFLLGSRSWVPVELAGRATVARPADAWIETSEPPPRIRERIPRISDSMRETHGGTLLARSLGLIDAARPRVPDLLDLLQSVAAEGEQQGITRDIELAARWIQRTVNDGLPVTAEPHPAPDSIRVLASHAGSRMFIARPAYADDALLRDTWEKRRPVLSAESGLTALTTHLGLTKLDDVVTTTPLAYEEDRGELLTEVRRKIDATKPYIFALVLAENPRAEQRVRPALRRLDVVVCERLILRYQYDGDQVERADATCYIATRQELRGKRRLNFGTVYVELDRKTHEPDWFALGRQLAQHLDVASHADAITMLLKMNKVDRDRMMADRQIDLSAVRDARQRLNLPLEDEEETRNALDNLISTAFLPGVEQAPEEATEWPEPSPAPPDGAPGNGPVSAPAGPSEPPPIDWDSVELVDAAPGEVGAQRGASTPRAALTQSRNSSAPTVQSELAKVATGKRGEMIVFEKERQRVAAAGGTPGSVFWRSEKDELAPIDIVSVDDAGHRIYIEVKATSASDPSTPFDISRSELLEAGAYGDQYFIYRVTDANTASPRITRWRNPLRLIRENHGRLLLSGAQMELGLSAATADGADEGAGLR